MWMLLVLLGATPLEQAQSFEDVGDDQAAVAVLERAVGADARWAMARVELGRLQLKRGQGEAALHHLDVARSLAPENPRAHYLFALAADEVGHRNESRQALEVALRLREGYADAQVRLAGVLSTQGEHRAAAELLRLYVAAHPDANAARLQWADALEYAGDQAEAERVLRTLMQVLPLKVVAGRRLVALLDAAGRHGEAARVRESIEPPRRQLRPLPPSRR